MSTFSVACFHLTPPNKITMQTFWFFFQIMAASVRKVCPGAEINLLTNTLSLVPDGLNCDQVFRFKTDKSQKECFDRLMAERVECWQAYFSSSLFQGPTVLIDVDVLVQKNPFALFDGSFDLGLTYRDESSLHTFNGGVILVDSTRPKVIDHYFERFVETVNSYSSEYQGWYCDQMAIGEILGDPDYSSSALAVMDEERDGVRYRLWPTQQWNYSLPLDGDNQPIFKATPDPGILHFKGERKALMLRYAVEILGIEATENAEAPGGWDIVYPS